MLKMRYPIAILLISGVIGAWSTSKVTAVTEQQGAASFAVSGHQLAELEAALQEQVVSTPDQVSSEPRTWTDATGKHTLEGTLEGGSGDVVTIRTVAGEQKQVPIARLSVKDAGIASQLTAPRVDAKSKVFLGKVVAILDGDTIHIRTVDEDTRTIRLDGIDAPEKGQPFGNKAQDRLGELVFQKDVRVEYKELDRYGRYLGVVYAENRNINLRLVRDGLAWHYRKYSKDEVLATAELVAKEEAIGIWSDKSPIAPWDWRGGARDAVAATGDAKDEADPKPDTPTADDPIVYITDSGAKYHRSGCRHLKNSSISIPLSRAKSAYDPCGTCKPPK